MVKVFNLTSIFYPFSPSYSLISPSEKFVPLNPKTRFVAGAPAGVGSFKPRKIKGGKFYMARIFFPI